MGFHRAPFRTRAPVTVRAHVYAVGQRVFVARSTGGPLAVRLNDDAGKVDVGCLDDGTEVAVLAWRPGWAGNTRYRVRATAGDTEGWLPGINLRATQIAVTPASVTDTMKPTAPLTAGDGLGRRFGQRA